MERPDLEEALFRSLIEYIRDRESSQPKGGEKPKPRYSASSNLVFDERSGSRKRIAQFFKEEDNTPDAEAAQAYADWKNGKGKPNPRFYVAPNAASVFSYVVADEEDGDQSVSGFHDRSDAQAYADWRNEKGKS